MAKGTKEKMWRKALGLTAFLVFVGFGAVVVSLFRWQVLKGEELSNAALDQSLRSTTLSAMRGTIYDATGKVMAQSASVWTVVLEPAYFADYDDPEATRQKVAQGLASILEMDQEEVYEKTQGNSYFVYLKRRVETSIRDEINQFLEDNKISSGVRLIEDYKRYYPYGTVASTVLGFTGTDGQGLEGLELQYDSELRGTAGRLISAKNALGTDMPFEYEKYVEAEDGYNLVVTIDETVQSILEKYLAEGVDQFNVKNGAVAIAMDVDTGAILGMATTPTYDPNDPFTIYDEDLQAQIDALSGEEQDEAFNAAQLKQWRNKAVSDTYYPGSVFKMCTYAMGLEEGVVTEDSTFTCGGGIIVEGYPDPISCWKTSGHGLETFREGLYNSCNPWAIHIGQLLGGETFAKYREAFGFTESTGIDLPGEAAGQLHSKESIGPTELATMSFGQTFNCTSIQVIAAFSSLINGGNLVKPHVVSQIVDADGNVVLENDTEVVRRVISEKTSAYMRTALKATVENGLAKKLEIDGYSIGCKTGTAEQGSRTNDDLWALSNMSYFPAENPKYIVFTVINQPSDYVEGVQTPTPMTKKLIEGIIKYDNLEPTQPVEDEANLSQNKTVTVADYTDSVIFDVIGDLDGKELTYKVVGNGNTVVNQVSKGGTTVDVGSEVILYVQRSEEDTGTVSVPNVVGKNYEQAETTLTNAGFTVAFEGDQSGTVTAQDPKYGVSVAKGSEVMLTLEIPEKTDTSTDTTGTQTTQ